jgi:glucokinase
MTAPEVVIAVDVGGTTIKGAVVDPGLRFVHELARPTPVAAGPEAVLGELEAVAEALASAARGQSATVRSLAVMVPGIVDAEAGRAAFSANLGLRDAPVRDRLQSALDLPTVIEHDVRAAGVAERALGAARGVDDHLLVVIGTGIAAVVHSGAQTVRGASGVAGELGHLPVWPGGEPCPCGQRGCLERYASAAAITRRYAELGGAAATSARAVAARRRSDPAAERAWREATDALALALVSCTVLLDPEMIVLAGGLSEAGEDLSAPVQAALAARLSWRAPPAIRLSPLGARAGLVGAALLAWRRVGVGELV